MWTSNPARSAGTLVLALAYPSFASVIVVDDSGGADFTQVSAAVAAAADGDTILVKAGTYDTPYTIQSKSLTIVAELGATVAVQSIFTGPVLSIVRLLRPHQRVVIRGLDGPLALVENAGSVRVEDGRLRGVTGQCIFPGAGLPGGAGAMVSNCASVAFARCELTGGDGAQLFIPGVFDCCTAGGPGLSAAGSSIALYQTTLAGGPGGGHCPGGAPLLQVGGSVAQGLAPAHSFSATSPLRQNQGGTLQFAGDAGDTALLVIAPGPFHLPVPFSQGVLLVGPILGVVALGSLPRPSGGLDVPFAIADLPPPGLQAVDLYLQAVYARPSGYVVAAPSIVTVLDASF